MVAQVVTSDDPARDLSKIDVEQAALCEYPLALPPAKAGEAVVVAQRPGWMQIDVSCKTPQLLSVAESYHSGWRCTVDGNPRDAMPRQRATSWAVPSKPVGTKWCWNSAPQVCDTDGSPR